MLIAALLLHALLSSQSSVTAAPTPFFSRADSPPEDVPFNTNYRSTADIVWSCVVTVFACTWLSVHPNVSGSNSTWKQRMTHRIYLMIWGIAAPEFLVIFAYRQWRGSKDITRVIRKVVEDDKLDIPLRKKWTNTHSHYLQMGGFMFQDPNSEELVDFIEVQELLKKQSQDVGREALHELLKNTLTEDEIWDKSKGDTLAKAVVALQTTWFLTQIVGRAMQHLTITELEVITLAYAAFNAVMYAFWWNKPLDAQCPLLIPFSKVEELRLYNATYVATITDLSFVLTETSSVPEDASQTASIAETYPQHERRYYAEDPLPRVDPAPASPPDAIPMNVQSVPTWLCYIKCTLLHLLQRPLMIMHRVYILTGFKRPGKEYVFSVFDHRSPSRISGRQGRSHQGTEHTPMVPMFYTYSEAPDIAPRSIAVSALAMFLASCFGAAHCIAWAFSRLTPPETLLWRICALLICLAPIGSCLTFLVATWYAWLLVASAHWRPFGSVKTLIMRVLAPFHNNVFVPVLLPLYLVARLVLIGLAFVQLRRLSRDAHQTVEWSDFLPHI
ncbi:hypothetical protein BKA70DRAFT_1421777 [Coprinopsis sp. MPI-PUGE-AT-0042]|nr:hypothetical protein BKA70DRAFT_1421777 [Coprinopsis sp. MPI-PUGE-AT-0042]